MQAHHPCNTMGLAIMAATARTIDPSLTDPAGVGTIGGKAGPQVTVIIGLATVITAIARRRTVAHPVMDIRGAAARTITADRPMAALPMAIPGGNVPARRSGGT